MNILQINTSLHGQEATSSQLANTIVTRLQRESDDDSQVQVRDLGTSPLPHLTAQGLAGFQKDPGERDDEQHQVATLSDKLIAELSVADTVVLGLPMYNFGIPSGLKAWIDHVARAGVTFRYTSNGPEGLLKGKKLIVAATRGGRYAGTPTDIPTAYIKQVFAFIGIEDVEFVYAEGLAGAERENAIEDALKQIEQLAA